MKNIVLFEKLSGLQNYRVRWAFYLTLVPLIATAVLLIQLLIFSMLNLYYLEGNGLIIDAQIREAYYQQVFDEVTPILLSLLALIATSFIVSLVAMNWATAPFRTAENNIRNFKDKSSPLKLSSSWASENPLLDRAVHAFLKQLATGEPQKEFQRRTPFFGLNVGFLFRFVSIYLVMALITGAVLGSLLNQAFTKIVSLALNLLPSQVIRGHYFTAQEQVLSLGVITTVVVSVFVYCLIGFQVTNYMSTMVMVFYRSFKEQRFPIQLRKSDVYHSLALAVNEKVEQFGKK